MSVKSVFILAIGEGMKAAKLVQDPASKANAYAALALAMAQTGSISISENDLEETPASASPAKGKEALKPETSKATAKSGAAKSTPKAEVAPEPVAEVEPEISEEWTEEMVNLKADQIAYINWLRESYEEEQLNNVVSQFSEGTMTSLDEITPLNVDAFVTFVDALLKDAEAEAQ